MSDISPNPLKPNDEQKSPFNFLKKLDGVYVVFGIFLTVGIVGIILTPPVPHVAKQPPIVEEAPQPSPPVEQPEAVSETPDLPAEPQVEEASPTTPIKKEEFDQQFAMLKSTGFIMGLRPEVNTILINPAAWAELDLSRKEGITEALSAYCEYYCAVTGPVVHLKDGYSGKELASFGMFGVDIK